MTIFIYTWSFLDVAIAERKIGKTKKVLVCYKYITVFVFPPVSYALYIYSNIEEGILDYDTIHNEDKETITHKKFLTSDKCLVYFNALLIILSIIHLGLLLWQSYEVTKRIKAKNIHEETKQKVKINVATTFLHIFVILAAAIIFLFGVCISFADDANWIVIEKILNTSTFIVGLQDLFVICMLWTVMDNTNKPLLQKDRRTGEYY